MAWIEFSLALGDLDPERVQAALEAAGALSVTLEDAADQPLYELAPHETLLWNQTRLTALFPAEADLDGIRAVLLASLDLPRLPPHRIEALEDREWVREWLRDFKPMRFGRRLWICPTAYVPPEPDAVNIVLDPGLAFGTGTHPTTALCLEWLDGARLEGRDLIDYGCGSGVLAIAAARLGAQRVVAVDHDPQALLATAENARRNGVSDRIEAFAPDDLPRVKVPVLLANILAGPLMILAPVLAAHTAMDGIAILSGILVEQEPDLRRTYEPAYRIVRVVEREGWLRMEMQRRPEPR